MQLNQSEREELLELRRMRDAMHRESNQALDMRRFISAKARWSRETFGNGPRTIGILKHIRKELEEIEADPFDLEEWIDVFMLATDGFWRAWVVNNPEIAWDMDEMGTCFMNGIRAKHLKNVGRKWAAGNQNVPSEHIREGCEAGRGGRPNAS